MARKATSSAKDRQKKKKKGTPAAADRRQKNRCPAGLQGAERRANLGSRPALAAPVPTVPPQDTRFHTTSCLQHNRPEPPFGDFTPKVSLETLRQPMADRGTCNRPGIGSDSDEIHGCNSHRPLSGTHTSHFHGQNYCWIRPSFFGWEGARGIFAVPIKLSGWLVLGLAALAQWRRRFGHVPLQCSPMLTSSLNTEREARELDTA